MTQNFLTNGVCWMIGWGYVMTIDQFSERKGKCFACALSAV